MFEPPDINYRNWNNTPQDPQLTNPASLASLPEIIDRLVISLAGMLHPISSVLLVSYSVAWSMYFIKTSAIRLCGSQMFSVLNLMRISSLISLHGVLWAWSLAMRTMATIEPTAGHSLQGSRSKNAQPGSWINLANANPRQSKWLLLQKIDKWFRSHLIMQCSQSKQYKKCKTPCLFILLLCFLKQSITFQNRQE